jgi:uncharacterized RDD family membrane protein YckC
MGASFPAVSSAGPVTTYTTAGAWAGYGGFWIRFVAWIIDEIVLGIISLPIRIMLRIPGYHFGPFYGDHAGPLLFAIPFFFGANIVIHWLYEAFLTSSEWQATVGKKVLNLRVTDDAGNRLTFLHATGRYFAKWVSNLTLGIGYIMAGFTDRKRALHDMLAGTLVRKG